MISTNVPLQPQVSIPVLLDVTGAPNIVLSDSVLAYEPLTGAFDGVFVQPTPGNLNGPDAGMVFGPGGDLYVPSFWNHRVKRYDGTTGAFVSNFLTPISSGLTNPRTVLFPGDGTVLATSEGSDEVLRFDATTGDFQIALVTDDVTTGPDETGGLDGPTGMAVGPDGGSGSPALERTR